MQHNDYHNDTKLLSLGWGYVDESIDPQGMLMDAFDSALSKYGYGILQYENSYGFADLRNIIQNWAPDFFHIPQFRDRFSIRLKSILKIDHLFTQIFHDWYRFFI